MIYDEFYEMTSHEIYKSVRKCCEQDLITAFVKIQMGRPNQDVNVILFVTKPNSSRKQVDIF